MFSLDSVREELGIMVHEILVGIVRGVEKNPDIKTVDDVLDHLVDVAVGIRMETSA